MKIDNFNYIFKGVLLTVSGLLLAFFPGVINWIFYIIGGIVLIGCVFTLLSSLAGGDAMLLPSSLAGAAIGVGIMFLPRFVSVQIPVIAGLVLGVMGFIRLFRSFDRNQPQNKRIADLILGIVFIIVGGFLIFHPFRASKAARIIIGLVMLAFAAFNFYVAYAIKKRNENTEPAVIDIDDFTVTDDRKTLK
ncbi:MAG: DUF308 domain-containing protein [Ruminococcus sp.]|nr:DUF308 domain-containing protein [Ruminococcus sp.]